MNTIFRSILTLCLLSIELVQAQIPLNYYNGTQGLLGNQLKTQLNSIISNHTVFPYTSSSTDVWAILQAIDEDPNNSNNVILIYKRNSIPKWQMASGANSGEQDFWNREHAWPQSLGNFSTSNTAGTDVHHIFASDVSVNSARGNKDFDNGGSPHPEAVLCNFTTNTWEPPNEVKGDIARAMFYMVTRYEGNGNDPDLELNNLAPNANGSERLGVLNTLLQWHLQDPVDSLERLRNDRIYYQFQQNRNPFVDHPEFVTFVFDSANAVIPSIEPGNHVTQLKALFQARIEWQNNSGAVSADGYLIKYDTDLANITDPIDGVDAVNAMNQQVANGSDNQAIIGGLEGSTKYYFKVFPFTGSGSNTNYKVDGNVPTFSYTSP